MLKNEKFFVKFNDFDIQLKKIMRHPRQTAHFLATFIIYILFNRVQNHKFGDLFFYTDKNINCNNIMLIGLLSFLTGRAY